MQNPRSRLVYGRACGSPRVSVKIPGSFYHSDTLVRLVTRLDRETEQFGDTAIRDVK